jgi:hypothetical protein
MRHLLRLFVCLLCFSPALAAEAKLDLTRSGNEAALKLSGENGVEYVLEAGNSLNEWNVLSSFLLNDLTRMWREPAQNSGARFYRARTVAENEDRFARNFRLIDHNGVAQELHYFAGLETLKAVVLIFTEGNYPAFASKISELRNDPAFQEGVFFWTIDTRTNTTRSKIKSEAALAEVDWPVLHDPLHLTKRDYQARFNGEVFVVRRADLAIVYRGKIDDATGAEPPTNQYLATALSDIMEDKPIVVTRMEPAQNRLTQLQRPIADYSTVIAPLLQQKCVTCHSPGNIGPFALTNHQSVVTYADQMREQVTVGNMPPWHADPEYGKFKNNISLTALERGQLVDWLAAGAPRGNGVDDPLTHVPPPPPKWPAHLGPPDQIVTIPLQQVPATGAIDYRYILAYATNQEDRWLRAAVVRPSNPKVVHHYNVWEGRTATPLVLAAYSPGRNEGPYPEGTGWLLRANMEMTFNLHYNASGQEETDQPELALWYASAPPARPLRGEAAQEASFTIPPGERDFEVWAQYRFEDPARLYMVNPHMHVRGSRMRFELTVPGQPKRIIASVPRYEFHWQTIYYFDPPLDLPGGSVIDVIGAFDNSHLNPENPDPTAFVGWGDQSWDEMFIGYMEFSDL